MHGMGWDDDDGGCCYGEIHFTFFLASLKMYTDMGGVKIQCLIIMYKLYLYNYECIIFDLMIDFPIRYNQHGFAEFSILKFA